MLTAQVDRKHFKDLNRLAMNSKKIKQSHRKTESLDSVQPKGVFVKELGDVDNLHLGVRPAAQSWAISCVLLKQSRLPLHFPSLFT